MRAGPIQRPRPPRGRHQPPRSHGFRSRRSFTVYSAVVTNTGNAETAPVVEVTGPTPASWFVAHGAQGKAVWVNLAVPAGQTLSIDFATRLVTLAGVAVSGVVDVVTTRWWTLGAGANTITASVVATVRHHHAYR